MAANCVFVLPYLQNNLEAPVHDYLIWSGIHARAWGFMSRTAYHRPLASREMAPFAYVVIKDDYALRYIGETREKLYKDIPNGLPAHYEMYDIKNDPGERRNLLEEKPEVVQELRSIRENEAVNYPPPVKIGKDKWEELMPGKY